MKAFAWIILLAFAAHTFSKTLIVLDYYTNQGAFSKNCVNKARPQMHCNGHCQMMRKLREQEKRESQAAAGRYAFAQDIISSRSFFPELPAMSVGRITWVSKDDSRREQMPRDFFHPPGRLLA